VHEIEIDARHVTPHVTGVVPFVFDESPIASSAEIVRIEMVMAWCSGVG